MSTMLNLPARPPVYDTVGELPTTASPGAQAVVLSTPPAIYLYDGEEWNFAGGGTTIEQILGTENQIDVTPGGEGIVTLSTPQDIDTNANFEVNSIGINTAPVGGKSTLIAMPGSGTTRYGLQITGASTVTNTGEIAGFVLNPDLGCSSGTLSVAYTGYVNPIYSGNTSIISDTYGFFIDSGAGAGTITSSTNLRVKVPATGTNKYTAYFDPGVGIGAPCTDIYTLRVNSASNANTYIGLLVDGTILNQDPNADASIGILGQMVLSAPTGGEYLAGLYLAPTFTTPLEQTVNYVAGLTIYPILNTNAGELTTSYALYVQSGSVSEGHCPIAYGLYVETPDFGSSVRICAAFEGPVQFLTNSTGAASCSLSNNSPATEPTAPFTWIHAFTSNGTLVYLPAWK